MSNLDLVIKLKQSGNKILEAAAEDFKKWLSLKHCKSDLELFLQFNITHLKFKPVDSNEFVEGIYTSNTRLIKVLKALKIQDKKKNSLIKSDGIRTKDSKSVLSYNIIEEKYNTINISAWEIVDFITIDPKNSLILDEVINNILHKKISKDLKNNSTSNKNKTEKKDKKISKDLKNNNTSNKNKTDKKDTKS